MKLVKFKDLFQPVKPQPMIRQKQVQKVENQYGVNYVAAITKNNGVKMLIRRYAEVRPAPRYSMTIPVDGHGILCAFLQCEEFYCSELVVAYTPVDENMSIEERLMYCMCVRKAKFKFNYGKKPKKALPDLLVPAKDSLPSWIYGAEAKITISDILKAENFGFDHASDIGTDA